MHFISRSVIKYRRDEKNCHAGCVGCNVFKNGNYIIYTLRMQGKFGIEKVDEMINDKQIQKVSTPELEDMIRYYQEKVGKLQK